MASPNAQSFRPLPFLGNPHVQTVVGHFANWTYARLPATSWLVPLPDGDVVGLHENTPDDWRDGDDCALLVHGLGGNHRSKYLLRMAKRLLRHRLRVYRIDLRGAGIATDGCERIYNAACSDDLRVGVESVRRRNPASRIFLVGFSLGGNIALKLAGEAADRPVPGLAAVASVAAPIDLIRCAELILRYPFYDRYYVRNLIEQVDDLARRRVHLPRIDWPKGTTLRRFDELYTAPRGGFADALDYYHRASAVRLVPQIAVPAFLLTARDDPFVDWRSYEELPPRRHLRVHVADGGGHLGFLGSDGRGGFRWADTQIVDWLVERASREG